MTWGQFAWRAGPYVVILILVTICALQHAALIGADFGRLQAIVAQNTRANDLAGQLNTAQAAASLVTEKTVVKYVDRIKRVPGTDAAADRERDRLGTLGVRAIVCGEPASPTLCPSVAVPAAGADPRRK